MKKKFNVKKAEGVCLAKGVTYCEVRLAGCDNGILTFAHRLKRRHYPKDGVLLNDPNEYVLACMKCHQKMEKDPILTRQIFNRLRGAKLK